jgi:flagellar basal-body rod protein FlgF
MSDGIYAALSGAVAQELALETTANNAANLATSGYQSERAVFHEILGKAKDGTMHFTSVAGTELDPEPGPKHVTGNPLDVALGKGDFLAVTTPRGERYTRAGSLHLDTQGTLVGPSGDPVTDDKGQPIKVDPTQPLQISEGGQVTSGSTVSGQLRIVKFDRSQALQREGSTLLQSTAASGAAKVSDGKLMVGAVEDSNASPVRAMTDLVSANRMFEAFQKAIQEFNDADKRVLTAVAEK